jgi:pyruvate-formate lyase
LKEDVLKDLEKVGNEYKIDEAKKALTEAIKAKYVGNAEGIKEKNSTISALLNADDFANFIKNEFQDRKEFDDIVIKIAISVQKDEIAQTVVRSPFHRVRPKPEISGGDAIGVGNVTHVASGQKVGAEPTKTRASVPPTGASPSL